MLIDMIKKKLDSRCENGICVGYDKNSPAYMVYYPGSRKIKKHKLVRFVSKTSAEQQTQTDVTTDDDDDFEARNRLKELVQEVPRTRL